MRDLVQVESERYRPAGPMQVESLFENLIRVQDERSTIEVTALAPDVFRVGMFLDGRTPSYVNGAIPIDVPWETIHVRHESVETTGQISLVTDRARAIISLRPFRLRFEDAAGRPIAEDDPALGMGHFSPRSFDPVDETLGPPVRVYKRRLPGERYFGCGERTGGLEKTDSHQIFWNIDPPSGHNPAQSNLYTSIPLVLVMNEGQAWGMFFDHPGHVEFDLACEQPDQSWFGAGNGNLIYYVFTGPSLRAIVDRYTHLTGRTPMPPLWALGYQQSRYSYMNEDELRQVAHEFRARNIPCDVLYLDIHYMDGYRVFTWNQERFPDPATLLSDLRHQGFQVVTIADPGIKVDDGYAAYRSGRDSNIFCKTREGLEYRNVVWPGLCAFPDFTSERARQWWGDQIPALLNKGVAGIWCDMNEPALFVPLVSTMPDDVIHPGDGIPQFHAQIHNLYGSLMAQATREGLQKHQTDRRPFVISRSGFAGLQRHALHWTGDNNSWWIHLRMSIPQLQNLGLCGMAWVGVDVGGFTGDVTPELLTRWMEAGVFQPFCRNHTALGTRPQEPWAFGEPYESIMRTMIMLRQRLIPYLYTLFEECHRTGAPIIRPLLFAFPDDTTGYGMDDEFLLGDGLLVAPILEEHAEYRHVYLPAGTWFHYWTNEQLEGPTHRLVHAPLGQPAIYVRANVAIPLYPEMQYVNERPMDPLTLLVFLAPGTGEGYCYEDAGEGHAYQDGAYSRRHVTVETNETQVLVRVSGRDGTFMPQRQEMCLEMRGMQSRPTAVGVSVDHRWEYDASASVVRVIFAETEKEVAIEVLR